MDENLVINSIQQDLLALHNFSGINAENIGQNGGVNSRVVVCFHGEKVGCRTNDKRIILENTASNEKSANIGSSEHLDRPIVDFSVQVLITWLNIEYVGNIVAQEDSLLVYLHIRHPV